MIDNILEIKDLKHFYNKNKEVLKGLDIEVAKGEIISILGPSGCGKTTLLRIIAGLEKQSEGTIITVSYTHLTLPTIYSV